MWFVGSEKPCIYSVPNRKQSYLINADLYSCEEKRKILSGIYSQKSVNTMDDDMIESLFKEAMFKEIQRLEHDIQNFS